MRRWPWLAIAVLAGGCLPFEATRDAGPADPAPLDAAGPRPPAADAPRSADASMLRDAPADRATVDGRAAGPVDVTVAGYQLLVHGGDTSVPYDIRGICWSPSQPGDGKPGPSDFSAAADRDLPLMRAAGINTVKTYSPLERVVLDKLHASGMKAIVTVALTGSEDVAGYVTAMREHPALLMWVVGNEWNLNHLFGGCAGDGCYARVNELARMIKSLDPHHPVATSFAPNAPSGVPSDDDLRRLDAIDVWGLNVYSQPGFFNRFQAWRLLAQSSGIEKPFFMSEYGADAYDNRTHAPNEAAQAAALRQQTSEIRAHLSAADPAFPCLGGTPFEWSDEWWKSASWTAQDAGGFPNGGVAPDSFANEDWWGVVDVSRTPRAAYRALQDLYGR